MKRSFLAFSIPDDFQRSNLPLQIRSHRNDRASIISRLALQAKTVCVRYPAAQQLFRLSLASCDNRAEPVRRLPGDIDVQQFDTVIRQLELAI